jgi:hypothetical protein
MLGQSLKLMMQPIPVGHLVLDGFRILCGSGLVAGCWIGRFGNLVSSFPEYWKATADIISQEMGVVGNTGLIFTCANVGLA